jgi:hypothetical protein
MDRFGKGQYLWTAGPETNGSTALIRANAHAGEATVTDVSDAPFFIANGGTAYYVNDSSLAGNEYTTAAGDNLNSGKDPAHPMASLGALIRAYDLDPGDIVYVDTGTYDLDTNVKLLAEDSGVRIQGPVSVGHTATLDRGNTNSEQYTVEIAGATGVPSTTSDLPGDTAGSIRVTITTAPASPCPKTRCTTITTASTEGDRDKPP